MTKVEVDEVIHLFFPLLLFDHCSLHFFVYFYLKFEVKRGNQKRNGDYNFNWLKRLDKLIIVVWYFFSLFLALKIEKRQ